MKDIRHRHVGEDVRVKETEDVEHVQAPSLAESDINLSEDGKRTAKYVRRAGYVLFFGLSLGVFIPMLIGTATGINRGEVWDPFTGKPIITAESVGPNDEDGCLYDAQALVFDAGKQGESSAGWEERYREWNMRCRKEQPDLYVMLKRTRTRLRKSNGGTASE